MRRYTLIELIVTIAMIAILTSLLITAMQTGINKQKTIACVANAKDIVMATAQYTGDHGGTYPEIIKNSARNHVFKQVGVGEYGWDDLISSYMGYNLSDNLMSGREIMKGEIGSEDFDTFLEEFRCPASSVEIGDSADSVIINSYAIHRATGLTGGRAAPWERNFSRGLVSERKAQAQTEVTWGNAAKVSQIVNPSEAISFVEWQHPDKEFGSTILNAINLRDIQGSIGPSGSAINQSSFTLDDAWPHGFGKLTYTLCDGRVKNGDLSETVNDGFNVWDSGNLPEKGNGLWDCWPGK